MSTDTSACIAHTSCEECGSRDNVGVYDDGHTFCFGCRNVTRDEELPEFGRRQSKTPAPDFLDRVDGEVSAIVKRKLTLATCQRYDYRVGTYKGEPCHVANFRDPVTRQLKCQKIRMAGKKFITLGDGKDKGLFGQHLFTGGKYLTITEGEIDALSVSQAFGNKFPVVSLPDGAGSAEKAIRGAYEWLEGFDTIVLMFDMDDRGREAAAKVAPMLPPGKVKIAHLHMKDANLCLLEGKEHAIQQAFWDAKPFRPDGILMASDLRELVRVDQSAEGIDYPWECVSRVTRGIRPCELITITAGSGVGKTTFVREIAYHLHHTLGKKVGLIMLEESNKRTLEGLVGLHLDKNILVDREDAPEDLIVEAFDNLFPEGRDLVMYDHFGSTEIDNICNRIRYMAKVCGVTHVILDHISILVSGIATGDERKLIDMAMTKLRTLVQETGITLFSVSHLKRPMGDRGHEDGAEVHLGQLRGSHAIAQLSDLVLAIQKPESGDNDIEIKILKNRFSGEVSVAGTLYYDITTGRLKESAF